MSEIEEVRAGIVKKIADLYIKEFGHWNIEYDWDLNEVQWTSKVIAKRYAFDASKAWTLESSKVLKMSEETGLFPEVILDCVQDIQDSVFEIVMGRKPGVEHGNEANS